MRSSHDSNNSTTARDHAPEASSQSIPVSQQIRASSTRRHTSTPHQSDPERQRELDEEQHGVEISVATRDQGNTVTDSDVPYYTGQHTADCNFKLETHSLNRRTTRGIFH